MKRAILIGSANFDPDSGIEPLRFPENDVTALESVLRSDEFGFDHISKVLDQASHQVVERLDELMLESDFDDFILIYFSGHGKINSTGELFLSCRNTRESRLNSTGLKYRHIMDLLEAHARDRVAIILDCCYAGRAVSGLKGSVHEQVKSELDSGRGIFVLGASGATQTAEERELDGHGIFTKQIIEGLTSGAADIDSDGSISLSDLAKYVRDEFRKKKISQDPIAAGMIKSGDLILGTNRKVVHSKMIADIRSKIDAARPQFSKATYRAVEDYLDEASARSDFGKVTQEQEFVSLRAFAARGSTEDVIVAFLRASRSEPSRQKELQKAPPITEPSTSAQPPQSESKPKPKPKPQAQQRDQPLVASDVFATPSLPSTSEPPTEEMIEATPAQPQRLESKPSAQQPHLPLFASDALATSSLPSTSESPIDETIETEVETAVQTGPHVLPTFLRPPHEEPDLELVASSSALIDKRWRPVNFIQAIVSGFQNYVNFSARAARSEFWLWTLFSFLASITAELLDLAVDSSALQILVCLALFLPSLAVSVRRLHDLGRTGWWLLLIFTVVGIVPLVFWNCVRGTAGPNRFGPDPLAGCRGA